MTACAQKHAGLLENTNGSFRGSHIGSLPALGTLCTVDGILVFSVDSRRDDVRARLDFILILIDLCRRDQVRARELPLVRMTGTFDTFKRIVPVHSV